MVFGWETLMTVPSEAEILFSVVQALPEDETGQQRVLRVMSRPVAPQMLADGVSHDLGTADLDLVTDFTGPWSTRVVALKFLKDDGNGNWVPNTDPKDFGIHLLLGGQRFPLIERFHAVSTGLTVTDTLPMTPGDQLVVTAHGGGRVEVQIRGEKH
jgi:hypothetical protein